MAEKWTRDKEARLAKLAKETASLEHERAQALAALEKVLDEAAPEFSHRYSVADFADYADTIRDALEPFDSGVRVKPEESTADVGTYGSGMNADPMPPKPGVPGSYSIYTTDSGEHVSLFVAVDGTNYRHTPPKVEGWYRAGEHLPKPVDPATAMPRDGFGFRPLAIPMPMPGIVPPGMPWTAPPPGYVAEMPSNNPKCCGQKSGYCVHTVSGDCKYPS
jgi:hypothetical protein